MDESASFSTPKNAWNTADLVMIENKAAQDHVGCFIPHYAGTLLILKNALDLIARFHIYPELNDTNDPNPFNSLNTTMG